VGNPAEETCYRPNHHYPFGDGGMCQYFFPPVAPYYYAASFGDDYKPLGEEIGLSIVSTRLQLHKIFNLK